MDVIEICNAFKKIFPGMTQGSLKAYVTISFTSQYNHKSRCTEGYLQPCELSVIKLFCESSIRVKPSTIFAKYYR